MHSRTHTHPDRRAVTHKYTQDISHRLNPPCISVLSFTLITPPPPSLCLSFSPRTVSIGRFFSFLFGLPRPLINPTNSKGYINVDNQFLYVSSQSLEKKIRKKIKTFIQLCKCVFLTIFNVITSSNLILLPLLQLVLKYA